MKWLSFHYRGLASRTKKLALKRLLDTEPSDIVFLQETLGKAEQISQILHSMLPGWCFYALYVNGRSGGYSIGH